jgi:DNA (cytosine-5)-methyltransferase 1
VKQGGGLNHGDAFAGIGGFGLAAKRVGWNTVWACEIEPSARAIYSARLGHDGLRFDTDIRESQDLPRIDILTGGFPCQDISIAGKRRGLAGKRSGLFFELVRILEISRPAWFVFENVDALLSSNYGRDMGVVLSSLVECGYRVAWRILDSQFFGVAQRRARCFLVGHSADVRYPAAVLFEQESGCRNSPACRASWGEPNEGDVCGTLVAGGNRGYRIGAEDARDGHLVGALLSRDAKGISSTIDGKLVTHPAIDTARMGAAAGVSRSLDLCAIDEKGSDSPRYRGLGNAATVNVVEWIFRRIAEVNA